MTSGDKHEIMFSMTWRTFLGKLLLVILVPIAAYIVIYFGLGMVGIRLPVLIESFITIFLEVVAIVYIFGFYKPEVFKKLSSQPVSIIGLLILIPFSLAVRIPTVLVFVILDLLNLFPQLFESFDEGVKFQWSDLVTPTGFGQPVDITLAVLIAVILTPIAEELLFRGVIFNFLRSKLTISKAIIFTSVIFALVHVYVGLLIGSFILGLALTWIYYKWKNITYPIVLHAFINLLPFLLGVMAKQ